MEVFPGWENYVERIALHWRDAIRETDTVVLPGDFSWGMSLVQALPDFQFLHALPGRKILLKGNHDYWWMTQKKMTAFFDAHGLSSLEVLHNNSVTVEDTVLCGSRGWLFETGEPFDDKIINREAMRLELSLSHGAKDGRIPVVFLHYPPVYGENVSPQILEVLKRFGVRECYYGHVHAAGCRWALNGAFDDIEYRLVSGDYLGFHPLRVR